MTKLNLYPNLEMPVSVHEESFNDSVIIVIETTPPSTSSTASAVSWDTCVRDLTFQHLNKSHDHFFSQEMYKVAHQTAQ